MEILILFRAGLRRHKGSLSGVLVLLFLVSLALGTVLTVWRNSGRYVSEGLERAGFGTLTAWVSHVPDLEGLAEEIAALPEVNGVEAQEIIFSNYEIDGQESDSEGQLIILDPGEGRYRFFTDNLSGFQADVPEAAPGQVYISPSLVSMFGVEPGDEIVFPIARAGGTMTFTVAGFYEDPMMGSSMIGMKGFLICREDHDAIVERIRLSGIDALARDGAMLHIFGAGDMATSALNQAINERTSLPAYTEFVHTAQAIQGFMLILQNAFCGLLLALVAVLLAAVLVVLSHSIGSAIEADYKNMGILKTVGFTSGALRRLQLLQYGAAVLAGMALGLALTLPAARLVGDMTLTTTGIRVPARFPALWCAAAHLGLELGDTVTVSGGLDSGDCTVTGIYSCANDMGDNIGMTAEGYLKIGRDDPQIWCHHYFLSDPSQKSAITQALETAYGGDVHVHENTWPGLFGIIAAMRVLLAFTYAMTAAFIFIVTAMTGSRLLAAEQRDIGIYKALGFSNRQLRASFALRFGLTAALGGVIGATAATLLTDPLVSSAMKLAGISNFASAASLDNSLLPVALVTGLFTAFAYLWAGTIKKTDLTALITE